MALCQHHGLDAASTQVDWIYASYQQLITQNIHSTRRLCMKRLAEIIAALTPLCYGGIQHEAQKLTPDIFHSLAPRQCKQTTYMKLVNGKGKVHFCFHHVPSWLHCTSPLGLQFLVNACVLEVDQAQNSLVNHGWCPLYHC